MQTSYFAKASLLPNAVSIAIRTPLWAKVPKYADLAPTWDMVQGLKSGILSESDYMIAFNNQLKKLNVEKVYNDLENCILLCWEKSGKFCHRRLVAKWIQLELGIFIPELDYE